MCDPLGEPKAVDEIAKTGATLAAEEYVPTSTTDFTAVGQRLFDGLKDKPGKKLIARQKK